MTAEGQYDIRTKDRQLSKRTSLVSKMKRLSFLLIFCCFIGAMATRANAAEIVNHKEGGSNFIFVMGEIEAGDAKKFKRIAAQIDEAVVLLESEGGLVVEAIDIGETIRLKGFGTAVFNGSICSSSCGLIWLAGTPRSLSRSAKVGFHAAYRMGAAGTSESGVANAIVGRYLTLLNLPERLIVFATSPKPQTMAWVTASNFSSLGIEVGLVNDIALKEKPVVAKTPKKSETQLWKDFPHWVVAIDHSVDSSCYMRSIYPDGMIFRTGYSAIPKSPWYVSISNKAWKSLKKDEEYDLQFTFDTKDVWDFPMKTVELEGGLALFGIFSDSDFWNDLGYSKSFMIKREGKVVAHIDLVGSMEAVKSMISCQSVSNKSLAKDPFAN